METSLAEVEEFSVITDKDYEIIMTVMEYLEEKSLSDEEAKNMGELLGSIVLWEQYISVED